MEKAVRALRAPATLIAEAEREDRLPPGTGLVIAFGISFVFYVALIALLA